MARPDGVLGIPLFGEVVAICQLELVSVNLEVLSDYKVLWFVDLALFGLVRASLEELTVGEP